MESDEYRNTKLSSKTQRKKEALALQKLGQQLIAFNSTQLQQLPLSEKLIAALVEFNRLPNSHGARRRQLQFIGRLMRDFDFEAVTKAVTHLQSDNHGTNIQQQETTEWCEKIFQGGDNQITKIIRFYPQLERQKLRQLCREYNSANESQQQKTKSKLQIYLQQLMN